MLQIKGGGTILNYLMGRIPKKALILGIGLSFVLLSIQQSISNMINDLLRLDWHPENSINNSI